MRRAVTCRHNTHLFVYAARLQAFVKSQGRNPGVWNEVWDDPSGSQPNGALPYSTIEDWTGNVELSTAAGFTTINAKYDVSYLDNQCCAAGAAAMSNGSGTALH